MLSVSFIPRLSQGCQLRHRRCPLRILFRCGSRVRCREGSSGQRFPFLKLLAQAWRGFPGSKILTLELISTGVKFLYWTPQECVRTGSLCKGHQTKMLPLHSSTLFKPLGGGKRHNWVISYSFHHVKKKKKTVPLWTSSLEICVFSVFGLMYASAHFTRSKKGDLASHSYIQIVYVNWRWIALEGTGLYRLTIEFVHRVLLSNCSHCLLL